MLLSIVALLRCHVNYFGPIYVLRFAGLRQDAGDYVPTNVMVSSGGGKITLRMVALNDLVTH
ncbi:hypothetical protein EI94DRAFT_1738470 [Lactarius quietus]|nr:hypothetical protein EI94DRAFT_1738470 [Lactarius quietus]